MSSNYKGLLSHAVGPKFIEHYGAQRLFRKPKTDYGGFPKSIKFPFYLGLSRGRVVDREISPLRIKYN
jgi:hypothetical protein